MRRTRLGTCLGVALVLSGAACTAHTGGAGPASVEVAGSGGAPAGGGASGVGGAAGASGAVGGESGAAGTAGAAGTSGGAGAGAADAAVDGPAAGTGGVRWLGRVDATDPARPRFAWSASGFVARVTGGTVSARLQNAGPFVFRAVVDGALSPAFAATAGEGTYPLAVNLASGTHTVALLRQTEGVYGDTVLLGLTVDGGALLDPPPASARLIEVVGASVSCGYGNLGLAPCAFSYATESATDAYESVAARALGADLSVVAISGRGMYRNSDGTLAGAMPEIYMRTLAGASSPAWDFHMTPEVVVINLGKNDLAVGDPGQPFIDAYLAFVRMLRARFPAAFIVCTTGPNLGAAAHVRQLSYVQGVVATRNAEGDGAIVLLDWPEETPAETGCDVHPTAAKHQTMGAALAAVVHARLGW